MEAHPEEDVHAMVQRALEGAGRTHRRPQRGSQRRSEAHNSGGSAVSEESGKVQQKASRSRSAHGECGPGLEVYLKDREDSRCQHRWAEYMFYAMKKKSKLHDYGFAGSGDIVDGNLKLILGLIWTLILHYQISIGFGIVDGSGKKKGGPTAKQALVNYIGVCAVLKKIIIVF